MLLVTSLDQSLNFSEASIRNIEVGQFRQVETSKNRFGQPTASSNQAPQKKKSPKVKEYYESAKRKFEGRDYQGALNDLNRVAELDPNHSEAYKNRGDTKMVLKDHKGAMSDYNRAIQLDSNFVNAYNGRGFLKMTVLNDYSGALNDLNRAVKIQPNSVDTYSNLAVLKYVYMKDKLGGIADLQKVVNILQQKGEKERASNAAKTLSEWRLAVKKAGVVSIFLKSA